MTYQSVLSAHNGNNLMQSYDAMYYSYCDPNTNSFISIQVVLCYMQSSTSSQQFWVRHTIIISVAMPIK